MYEHMTFELILGRMLDRIPDTLDKREGSIIYDALAPAAVELQNLYIELDAFMNETFADTASRDNLIKRARERGLKPYPATKAILKMVSSPNELELEEGARFSLDGVNYSIIERLREGGYKIECEEFGVKGNKSTGLLVPIDYIEGLENVSISEILIPGEEEEETELFRKRYFDSFSRKAFGGNIADYIAKTNEIEGVGATKVTPIWNGAGTVKLTIINSEYKKSSDELIQKVQNEIDPSMEGTGKGLAPIGHKVTVVSVDEVTVNLSTTFTFDSGKSFEELSEKIKVKIETYLAEIRKKWAESTNQIVRLSQIESRILSVEGILDVAGTKINQSSENLTLSEFQIPVLGGVVNG